ncbi:MAG: hypothetical protein JNM63_13645, partial [Spirochaetia bacterium]|nr:hypothetical protein [Spirochaetia bacterium]
MNLSKLTHGDYSGVIQAGNTGLRADAIVGAMQGIQAAGWLDNQSRQGDAGVGRINIANMLGNTSDRFSLQTMDEIIGGSKQIGFDDLHGDNGRYEGNNRIILDNRFMSRGMEQGIMGASAAVHENTHLSIAGNSPVEEFFAGKAGLNTFRDLAGQFGTSIDWGNSDMQQMVGLDMADRAGMLGRYVAATYNMSGEDWGWKNPKTQDGVVLQGERNVNQVLGEFLYANKAIKPEDVELFRNLFMAKNRDKINADGTFKEGTKDLWAGSISEGDRKAAAYLAMGQTGDDVMEGLGTMFDRMNAGLFGGRKLSEAEKIALMKNAADTRGGEVDFLRSAITAESGGFG